MKRCPTCQRTYADDSQTFCLDDGTPLASEATASTSSEPPATLIFSEPPPTSSNRSTASTEVYSSTPTQGIGAPAPHTAAPQAPWTPPPSAPQAQPFGQTSWPTTAAAPPNKFVLALLGGVVMALPSLLPAVQWICCVWAAGGGLLAAALYIKKSPTRVEPGEGAMLGAITGGIGGLINLVAGLPIAYALYGPQGPYASKDGSLGAVAIVGVFGTMMLVLFSILGGLLAVPLFEKRAGAQSAPPPPPQSYGGGAGGYR